MFASTKFFVAGPPPPGPLLPEVERVTLASAGLAPGSLSWKPQTACAFAVNVPGSALLIWNVQVAWLPFCCGEPHVLFRIWSPPETLGVIEVIVGVVPDGIALVVTVNVCA